ncbi:MAG: OmpA family protein [Planctomycetes bacterium]|nr:OmpA family protein [Planctomycetota bacterium]MCB9920458.1 OmpA family protein [Planctomycetota bacterium]
MGKKKAAEEAPEGAPEWIVTFSDLVSLLVTLFIMLLAFSSQETHDLSRAMNIMRGSFGVLRDEIRDAPELIKQEHLQDHVENGAKNFDPEEAKKLEAMVRKLDGLVLDGDSVDRGVRILPDSVTGFAPGEELPSPQLAAELRRLGEALRKHKKRRFTIEGYADERSDRHSAYGDDYIALSLARARRTARILGLEGLPLEQIEVVARGIASPRGEGWTDEGQAKNRRIEIVIEPQQLGAAQGNGQGR